MNLGWFVVVCCRSTPKGRLISLEHNKGKKIFTLLCFVVDFDYSRGCLVRVFELFFYFSFVHEMQFENPTRDSYMTHIWIMDVGYKTSYLFKWQWDD